ncbi:cation diffusion facilitator family transporter [Chloroflexota bacterium]
MARRRHSRRKGEMGEGHREFMLLALNAAGKPLTLHGFRHQLQRMGHHFGMSAFLIKHDQDILLDSDLEADLTYLAKSGHVVLHDDGSYELTESGSAVAMNMDSEMSRVAATVGRVVSDGMLASSISMGVNAVLAALKLTAGFLLNSVALIADGFDSSVDVASAVAVYLGIRTRRELAATVFIIVVMTGTACFIAYESITKLIAGETVDASWIAFATAAVSGLVCYGMSVYQHFVGKRLGSLSLLSQSVDSRNHVIQAGVVIVGLTFAVFGIHTVDAIVGMVVAVLILRSAIELTADIRRAARGEDMDADRFQREYERLWNTRQRKYFESWLLVLLEEPHTKAELLNHYEDVFSTEDLPVVKHFSPARTFNLPEHLDSLLGEMQQAGKLALSGNHYVITDVGKETLEAGLKRWRFVAR